MEMMPVFLLFLLAAFSISTEVVNLNDLVDENLCKLRDYIREQNWHGLSSTDLNITDEFSIHRAMIMGFDTLQRTGDCKLIIGENELTYELQLGLGFLGIVIPGLIYNGENMSAIFMVRNNSFDLSFTHFQYENVCDVTVDRIEITSLGQVDFFPSNKQYEGADVDDMFQDLKEKLNEELRLTQDLISLVSTELWCAIITDNPKGIFTGNSGLPSNKHKHEIWKLLVFLSYVFNNNL